MIEGLRARRRQGVAVYVGGKGKHEEDYFYLSTVIKNVCRRSGTGVASKKSLRVASPARAISLT